jgi:hypothetical protein
MGQTGFQKFRKGYYCLFQLDTPAQELDIVNPDISNIIHVLN